MSVTIPHLQAPFALTKAGAAVVDQDTPEEVLACVRNIVSCPIGARLDLPNFGIPRMQFGNVPLPTEGIKQALRTWEPRATETITEEALSNDQERHIEIEVESTVSK